MASGFDDGATLAVRFRGHFPDGTLYGVALRAMADDWEAGGVVRRICTGWEGAPPGAVVQLRVLAAVFRRVLRGDAPLLEPYYPCLGGERAPDDALWPAMRAVLDVHASDIAAELMLAPQTNEVGRSWALLVGLFEAVRRTGRSRVRLLEPGASAGLNLLVDRFRFECEDWAVGPADSALVLRNGVHDAGSVRPGAFDVVARRGCDLVPVDPRTPDGRLWLTSFVWPSDVERHDRLRAALEVAAAHPVQVDEAPAGAWLEGRLDDIPDERRGGDVDGTGVLTVVWQSVTRMYWPEEETRRVAAAITAARPRVPLAHLELEYAGAGGGDHLELRLDGDLLADVGHHGVPVRLT